MSKTRREKEQMVSDLSQKLTKAEGAVLADYRGLDVFQMTELRQKLRDVGVEFKVVKNTLTKIAADKAGVEGLHEYLEGPVGIAFGYDDPVIPAKMLKDFQKENEDLEFKAGILNGTPIGREKVIELASIPGREQLLGKVCGTFQAPIAGFVAVAQGPIRKFVYALEAVKQEKEQNS